MTQTTHFDVIIIGGSYAGLSAGMALGRALRKVLILDSGTPCNQKTPHSHNFLTQDGETPSSIAEKARKQVLNYPTVRIHQGLAISGMKTTLGFEITTEKGEHFTSKKLIFGTGLRDIMPDIKGYSDCWGTSILHCPYCHGYEVRHQTTGILANGDVAFHYAELLSNWTQKLTIYTNGLSDFSDEQRAKLSEHQISVVEKTITELAHENNLIKAIVLSDQTQAELKALYSRPDFTQQCSIPEQLNCEMTEQGTIKIDPFQKTTVEGVFACGDCSNPMRSVSLAVASGTTVGAMVNMELVHEAF
ncbi:MAG: NAD(P)/FAD-dependent oxidoreductase [Flavobacteriales bacterium]|nr:NAD(P)/FAD-dependent oxidoreductase [Flavobacteriales bacterium]